MKYRISFGFSRKGPSPTADPVKGIVEINDQGVALVITLLLLFLLSVIGLAAVLSSSSDLMINGYYRNFRGSFYAADSGVNIARQAVYNYFNNASNLPSGTSFSSPPNPSTWAANAQASLNSTYGSSYTLNSYGQASGSWAGSFKITTTVTTGCSLSTDSGGNIILSGGGCSTAKPSGTVTGYTYMYTYTLSSVGSAQGSEAAQIYEQGTISVGISPGSGTTGSTYSFSAFGAFIDSFSACSASLVPGYLTGPMYAKGEWNFGSSSTGYTFTDPVSQTDSTFSYWPSSGGCVQSSKSSYGSITPKFNGGYNLGSSAITLPTNAFSQEWAVLDGMGCGENNGSACGNPSSPAPLQPTPQDMVNHNMQNVSQQPYATGSPLTAATSGVFLPYTCTGGSCSLNSNAGGIYVEGSNSNVTTSVTLSTSGTSGQVFTIAQTAGSTAGSPVVSQTGSSSCTYSSYTRKTTCTASFQQVTTTTTPTTYTTVTVNPAANTTAVSAYTQNANSTVTATASNSCSVSGTGSCSPSAPGNFSGGSTSNSTSNTSTTSLNLAGVPEDLLGGIPDYPSTGIPAATMLYVDGPIASLSGPSSGAAVQDNSMVTVVANGNVAVTGNITYKTEPVTTSATTSTPIDSLISSAEYMNQVLGIFTANGNFVLNPATSGANIEVDGSIAMISQAGETNSNIGHMVTANSVGTFTNIGGRIENRAYSVNMNKSNVYFDRRFTARSNFAPPWFPSTTVSQNVISSTITALPSAYTPAPVTWVYKTAGQ